MAGNGATMPVTTRVANNGRLVVTLGDEHQGVRRGTVDVLLRYTTSMRAQGLIQRAGSDVILELRTTPWARGLEGVEVRVALPTSARQAQWLRDDTPGVEATSATELSRDVVHAVRRHLPANERWVGRIAVDPSVFPWLTAGRSRRPVALRSAARPYGEAALSAGVALAVMALLVRALRRATPGAGDPSRRAWAAYARRWRLGVALQSLHILGVAHALPLGAALALAAAAALLPAQSTRPEARTRRPARSPTTPRGGSCRCHLGARPGGGPRGGARGHRDGGGGRVARARLGGGRGLGLAVGIVAWAAWSSASSRRATSSRSRQWRRSSAR